MATFHLVAPSGYCIGQEAAERGVSWLRETGHSVENTQVITRRWQRFAGSDAERLADLNQLVELSEKNIVLAVRGGYGMSRLLQDIDYAAIGARLRRSPLLICGHSDFTAFQLALLAQEGAVTFSGPMLAGNFGAPTLSEFTVDHFWQALREPRFTLRWSGYAPAPFSTQGTVWGGNLAMLMSLLGTPWMPRIEGGILVVEDINEHPYRVERMLLQLHQAGILAHQRAVVLGSFSAARPNDYDNGYNLREMADALRHRMAIPIIDGLAFGHEPDTVTLPLGAHGELHYDGTHGHLTLSGHPTLT